MSEARHPIGNHDHDILMRATSGRELPTDVNLSDGGLLAAARHGLLGVLHHGTPHLLQSQVRAPFARLQARQDVITTSLPTIREHLASAGVESVVVKGPAIAASYRDPRMRTFTDLDLVVPPDKVDRAITALTSLPWKVVVPPKGPAADKRDIAMTVRGVTFMVDLHWDLFAYRQLLGCASEATPAAWEGLAGLPGGQMTFLEPARLAFLCTHAILDHRFRLILFRDLAELAANDPDWDQVGSFATRHRLRSFCYVALELASLWAGAKVPEDFLAALRPRSIPIKALERLIPRIDPVSFSGRRAHTLNLVIVLLHDDVVSQARLVARAPLAVPKWRRRTAPDRQPSGAGRALVVVSSDARRGAEVFGSRIVDGLTSRGWAARLVSLTSDGKSAGVEATPLSTHRPSSLPAVDLALIRRLRREAAGHDVVLANGSSTLRYTAAALFGMLGRPAFVYASVGEPMYWTRNRLARWRHRFLTNRADLIAAVSRATARQLTDLGSGAHRVYWAPTGVDVPESVERSPHSGLHLLLVGSLSREKDPGAALAVVEKIAGSRLRIVGDGPLRDSLEKAVEARGLGHRVDFTGVATDAGPHFLWADILLLTSRTEGLPGVVLEAAAYATPAVAFDVGGTSETIVDGKTGCLIPPGRVDQLVAAVGELAGAPRRVAEMGRAARSFVQEAYSLEAAINRYEDILRRAIALRER